MAIGYMGRSGAAMANYYAAKSDSRLGEGVTPLRPGEDPLAAIDAKTRESIVNWEPESVTDPNSGPTFGDRIMSGLTGAGMGAVAGFVLLNGFGSRRYRAYAAKPMNARASLAWAGIGAAIGGIAGFTRGANPLAGDARERVARVTTALPPSATTTHPAFASLHG